MLLAHTHTHTHTHTHAHTQIYAYIYQWNKTGNKKINPCTYEYIIFYKGSKNVQWDKDRLFNKWCWENWTATGKRMKLEHFVTHRQ